ncbi:lactate utilization protein [Aquabacterium sp.]|uniref:LutC/YkgG family protein n=1 Tax=Aquabacterium sp. TaxID=1872578 RepID=UPI0025C64E35|nr:lactate utilization protein [Aquabacterium sp.]
MSHTDQSRPTPPVSARERILTKLRTALAQAPGTTHGDASRVRAHHDAHRPQWDLAEKFGRLVRAMSAVQTEVHLVREADWPQRLATVVQAKAIGRLLLAPHTAHGALASEALQALGDQAPVLRAFDAPIESFKAELFNDIDAGFTRVRSAIAETGSLILWPDAHEPRTLSLVPPIHIALLDPHFLHATLYEAMQAEGWAAGLPTNALLVSGPSKTSDIQQTLAYGAHGPRQLVLILVVPEGLDDAFIAQLAAETGARA